MRTPWTWIRHTHAAAALSGGALVENSGCFSFAVSTASTTSPDTARAYGRSLQRTRGIPSEVLSVTAALSASLQSYVQQTSAPVPQMSLPGPPQQISDARAAHLPERSRRGNDNSSRDLCLSGFLLVRGKMTKWYTARSLCQYSRRPQPPMRT